MKVTDWILILVSTGDERLVGRDSDVILDRALVGIFWCRYSLLLKPGALYVGVHMAEVFLRSLGGNSALARLIRLIAGWRETWP